MLLGRSLLRSTPVQRTVNVLLALKSKRLWERHAPDLQSTAGSLHAAVTSEARNCRRSRRLLRAAGAIADSTKEAHHRSADPVSQQARKRCAGVPMVISA